jgi:hypothetical protein
MKFCSKERYAEITGVIDMTIEEYLKEYKEDFEDCTIQEIRNKYEQDYREALEAQQKEMDQSVYNDSFYEYLKKNKLMKSYKKAIGTDKEQEVWAKYSAAFDEEEQELLEEELAGALAYFDKEIGNFKKD